jgi:hypothetical protein
MLCGQIKSDGSDQFLNGQLSFWHAAAEWVKKLWHYFISSLALPGCGLFIVGFGSISARLNDLPIIEIA